MPRLEPKRDPQVSRELYLIQLKRGWSRHRAAKTPPIRDESASIVIDGKETTVSQARKRSGVGYFLNHRRLKIGWTKERAASTPPGHRGRSDAITDATYRYKGKRLSLYAWSKESNVPYRTLLFRVRRGFTIQQAIAHPFRAALPRPDPDSARPRPKDSTIRDRSVVLKRAWK